MHAMKTNRIRWTHVGTMLALVAAVAAAQQGAKPLPLKYAGPPTKPEITASDLMTRLYIFADDSMMGRNVGTEGNQKGTAYIEREVRKLGLKPAGDSGGYFQYLPTSLHALDTSSTLVVDNVVFHAGVDFLASSPGQPHMLHDVQVVFGGTIADTIDIPPNAEWRGKLVLIKPFFPGPGFNLQQFAQSDGLRRYQAAVRGAMIVTIGGEGLNPATVRNILSPQGVNLGPTLAGSEAAVSFNVTTRVADAMLGTPVATAAKGTHGKPASADIKFTDKWVPVRNVVAILPGSDPKLRGEYVAIGGHNDHIGFNTRPVDHDSIRAFNEVVRPEGEDSPRRAPTDAEMTRVRAILDSLRTTHQPRVDSIYNGADDDGSGSVSVLEIAEAFAKGNVKPKRSILFVWHVGEERGMWGSRFITDNPPVPRDSIVAQLNMDMVGRGGLNDITGHDISMTPIHGGPGYLQLIGSRRLSTELGDLVEQVNTQQKLGFKFDYALDANGHDQQIYCRSDHYMYARYGIPIVFFTTGGHADYHQVTDEPQYIDYDRMASVDKLVFDIAEKVANLDHRVVVDKPKPDPMGNCQQ